MQSNFLKFSLLLLSLNNLQALESIHDVSQLATGSVRKVCTPHTIQQIQTIVKHCKLPIAIAGGRFSQGGHVWNNGGIVIDMKKINNIRKLDPVTKQITVEAGATWHQIQRYIDLYGLSINVMQSYNDFTVGGSLSVNVHSRTIAIGALIETVESIKLVLADGSLVVASRTENSDLFKAAIGGYGSVGIIVEATLQLVKNEPIERSHAVMTIDQYPAYFKALVQHDPSVIFHNADLYPNEFQNVTSITWRTTQKPVTLHDRLQTSAPMSIGLQFARYFQPIKTIRLPLEALSNNTRKIVWRNYEMSTSVATAEPLMRTFTTLVLQEYFVPCDKLEEFVDHLRTVVNKYNVNMLNVSIRYIHQDTGSIMAYAQAPESFALVCYINMANSQSGMDYARQWTQELIDHVLSCDGTYYLPYQLHATKDQFNKVYPRAAELREIKNKVDPTHKFVNSFIQKYIL